MRRMMQMLRQITIAAGANRHMRAQDDLRKLAPLGAIDHRDVPAPA